jgi:hydrogenase nickel incorporation protein HypA/HybF
MRQVVAENLLAAYEALTRGTRMEGSVLVIAPAPVTVKCRECGAQSEARPPFFACAACSSGNVETTGGMELFLDALEIEEEDAEEAERGRRGETCCAAR